MLSGGGSAFQFVQIFARGVDDFRRNASERGDLQTVTLIRGTVLYGVQEDELLAVLRRIEMNVGASVQILANDVSSK